MLGARRLLDYEKPFVHLLVKNIGPVENTFLKHNCQHLEKKVCSLWQQPNSDFLFLVFF